MGYLITAISTNMWQRQRDGDKSKRLSQLLHSITIDNDGSKQDSSEPPAGKATTAETPQNSALPNNRQAGLTKIKNPHTISDITANLLFSATLLQAQ